MNAPSLIGGNAKTDVQGSALVGVEGAKPLALLAFRASSVTFQGFDLGFGVSEVVGDFVDEDVSDQLGEIFVGFDPFEQDGVPGRGR